MINIAGARWAAALACAVAAILSRSDVMPTTAARRELSRQDIDGFMQKLSNWGRWGSSDQRGALNLITPEKRRQAVALARDGFPVSLARDAIKVRADDSPPFEHTMAETGHNSEVSSSDTYSVRYHGFTVTHLDALCHVFYKGKMYNGFSQREVTDEGARKLSVIQVKNGILTRGVLMDMPRLFGVKYLEGSRRIYPEDLDGWEKKAGVHVASGDAIFIRTGRWARRAAEGAWPIMQNSAGLHASCLPWLKQRDVAVVASDLATDVMPSGVEGIVLPVHLVTIVGMGVPIIDNCDLEPLAEAATARKRWEFLLTAAPLAVEGGTGSPINPVAVF